MYVSVRGHKLFVTHMHDDDDEEEEENHKE